MKEFVKEFKELLDKHEVQLVMDYEFLSRPSLLVITKDRKAMELDIEARSLDDLNDLDVDFSKLHFVEDRDYKRLGFYID